MQCRQHITICTFMNFKDFRLLGYEWHIVVQLLHIAPSNRRKSRAWPNVRHNGSGYCINITPPSSSPSFLGIILIKSGWIWRHCGGDNCINVTLLPFLRINLTGHDQPKTCACYEFEIVFFSPRVSSYVQTTLTDHNMYIVCFGGFSNQALSPIISLSTMYPRNLERHVGPKHALTIFMA